MDYQLTFTVPGQSPIYRTVTGNTPAEFAQQAHRHARGHLASSRVDVRLDIASYQTQETH
ncbi:hypothetical protein [Streptomyces sp. NPDC005322]|uniref:hypothetical protein n=1 Tax=Streptomyces sp. NPDC005322 TaxID=3157032 RepID=UPI0033B5CDDD